MSGDHANPDQLDWFGISVLALLFVVIAACVGLFFAL